MTDRTPTRLLRLLYEKGPQPARSLAMHSRRALLARAFIEYRDNVHDSLEPLIGLTPELGGPWCAGYAAAGGWS